MIKRLYFTVLLMLFCININAAKTYYDPDHGIYFQVYNEQEEKVMVVKPNNNTSYSGTVTIPDSIKYEGEEGDSITAAVVAISQEAFQGCHLTALTLPATMRQIAINAFDHCSIKTLTLVSWKQLCEDILFEHSSSNPLACASHLYFSSDLEHEVTEWIIPEGITKINPYVFLGLERMTSVTLPNTLTEIDNEAFWGCTGLTEIIIPASVTTIGYGAFAYCNKITKVTFDGESQLNTIGDQAFSYCNALTEEISIPISVTTIGGGAFYNCSKIAKVTFAKNSLLESIGGSAFSGCTALTEISIPANVTNIGYGAFYSCSKIAKVTFDENALLETIGQKAFYGCSALTEISIPASVNSIGGEAFRDCTGMKNQKVTFASKEALCQITFGDKYANPLYYAHHLYYQNNTKEITALVLTDVEKISAAAFAGGENIITVTIPEAVKRFGTDAFLDCKSLQSVSFASTDHIINMKYDNEFASPLRYAQYVTLSSGNISSITINQDISDNLFAYSVWLNEVTIGSGCTKIGKTAFKGCEYLSKITIEEGLETIDNDAFKDCKNLESIILPASLKTIGSQAFYGCYKLKSITIPAGVENLSQEIFMNCTGLDSVTIASTNITIVPTSCFYNCTALKNVQLPNTIQAIGRAAFGKCSSLTALPTSSNLRLINNNAFTECDGIQTLELPSTVNFISQGAFSKCKGLTQLIINAPVTANEEDRLNIQSGVFADCDKLETIFAHANPAPTADPNAFGGKTSISLYYDKDAYGYDYELPWKNLSQNWISHDTIYYVVDRKMYKKIKYDAGERVTPEPEPIREGWDFSGWQGVIPDVMPGRCVEINGFFTTKQLIDGLYYHLDPVAKKATVIFHDSYKDLKKIEIPDKVTFEATQYYENSKYDVVAIADTAFVKCEKLEEITIPNSVKNIGRGAFKECTELYKDVKLPDSLTVLSDSLFYNCKNLQKIQMGAVEEIGASAFNECTGLSLSTLPTTVQKVGSLAFCNCRNLTEITIPASVEKFADKVFLGCDALKEVTFDTNCKLDTLPAYTFQNCYNLKKYMLAPTMKLIEEGAFMNCRSLDMVKIPESIGRIKERAFIGCSGITEVVIPESVKALGAQAFKGCTKIRYVIMDSDTPPSAIKTLFDDDIYSKDTLYVPNGAKESYSNGEEPWSLFKKIIERTEYTVTYLVDGEQFGNPQSYQTGTTIDLIDKAEVEATKPNRKFSDWKGVPAYQAMPDSNIIITGVFKYAITYKNKDDGKEICKDSLWYGEKVVAPAKLDSVGYIYQRDTVMVQMPAKDVTVTVTYLIAEGEDDYQGIHYYFYTQGENRHAEVMPKPGQIAYDFAEITIPQNALYKDINYPVTVIRNDAFKDCKNLTSITLSEGLKQIGSQAFGFCNKLTAIAIPQSVDTLGKECFQYCTSLKSVSFADGSKIKVLPAYTFAGCTALIDDVTLPTSLKTIANEAFRGCKNLKEIVLPEQVDSIGEYVFLGCDSLKKITIASTTTIPQAHENTFETYEDAKLYVSSLEVQANIVSPWDNFEVQLGESVIAEECDQPVITYDTKNNSKKLEITCDTEGATIVTNITVPDVKTTDDKEISLQKTFTVTAYAKKVGWRRSKTATETFNFEVGDVNGDGKVNIADVTGVINIMNQ